MTVLGSADLVTRHAPFGFLFRDASDLSVIPDGLSVRITDSDHPHRSALLLPTPSGTWMSPRLPGLGVDAAADPAQWPTIARPWQVEVADSLGRYLPVRFSASLPNRGRVEWPVWKAQGNGPRLKPLVPEGAPSKYKPDYLPLFPSIARTPPGPRATVRAHLAYRDEEGDRPAAWAAVTVSIDGKRLGIGLADSAGAVAVSFPYPSLPDQTSQQAAAGRKEVEWQAVLEVYHDPALAGDPPPLEDLIGQLALPPVKALGKLGTPDAPLEAQPLVLGRALTVRTGPADKEVISSLYLEPA
jgi:hypothetical protein